MVILNASGSPSTTWTGVPVISTTEASSVNPPAAARSYARRKQLGLKSLWGLHGAQAGPLGRAEHDAVGVDGLDGVADRQRGHDRGMTGLQSSHHAHDQRGRGERPRGVVDEDEFGVTDRRQREPNRLRADPPRPPR